MVWAFLLNISHFCERVSRSTLSILIHVGRGVSWITGGPLLERLSESYKSSPTTLFGGQDVEMRSFLPFNGDKVPCNGKEDQSLPNSRYPSNVEGILPGWFSEGDTCLLPFSSGHPNCIPIKEYEFLGGCHISFFLLSLSKSKAHPYTGVRL